MNLFLFSYWGATSWTVAFSALILFSRIQLSVCKESSVVRQMYGGPQGSKHGNFLENTTAFQKKNTRNVIFGVLSNIVYVFLKCRCVFQWHFFVLTLRGRRSFKSENNFLKTGGNDGLWVVDDYADWLFGQRLLNSWLRIFKREEEEDPRGCNNTSGWMRSPPFYFHIWFDLSFNWWPPQPMQIPLQSSEVTASVPVLIPFELTDEFGSVSLVCLSFLLRRE